MAVDLELASELKVIADELTARASELEWDQAEPDRYEQRAGQGG